jgi:hypothetical protein
MEFRHSGVHAGGLWNFCSRDSVRICVKDIPDNAALIMLGALWRQAFKAPMLIPFVNPLQGQGGEVI